VPWDQSLCCVCPVALRGFVIAMRRVVILQEKALPPITAMWYEPSRNYWDVFDFTRRIIIHAGSMMFANAVRWLMTYITIRRQRSTSGIPFLSLSLRWWPTRPTAVNFNLLFISNLHVNVRLKKTYLMSFFDGAMFLILRAPLHLQV